MFDIKSYQWNWQSKNAVIIGDGQVLLSSPWDELRSIPCGLVYTFRPHIDLCPSLPRRLLAMIVS
jgi:hypothetical protein